mmetsp:Transcript_25213/g.73996  ORF Transcript_25213/g.73996 Transcript_25213/m.73996 type:complete len:280 (-) Transcript_25213:185-1024(-)
MLGDEGRRLAVEEIEGGARGGRAQERPAAWREAFSDAGLLRGAGGVVTLGLQAHPPRRTHIHALHGRGLRGARGGRNSLRNVRLEMTAVALLDVRPTPVVGSNAAAAGGRAAGAGPRLNEVAVLRRAVVEGDLVARHQVTARDHDALVRVAAVHEPAGRVAGVVHVVSNIVGSHLRVALRRHVVELSEALVLIVARLVHEVAVGAARSGRERLDPGAGAGHGGGKPAGILLLGPDHLAGADAQVDVEAHAAADAVARLGDNKGVHRAHRVGGELGEGGA